MIQKLKIPRNSRALIQYNDGNVIEGTVLDATGECVLIQRIEVKFLFFKFKKSEWYSFSSNTYKLVVKKV